MIDGPATREIFFEYSDGNGSEEEWQSLLFNEAFSSREVALLLMVRESVFNVFEKHSISWKLPVLSLLSSIYPLRLIQLLASNSTNRKLSVTMLGGGSAYLGPLCYLSGVSFWGDESLEDSLIWQQELLSCLAPNQITPERDSLRYSLNDFVNSERTGDIIIFGSRVPIKTDVVFKHCHQFLKASKIGYLLIPKQLYVSDEDINDLIQSMKACHFECVESGSVLIFQPYEVSISCEKHKRLMLRREIVIEPAFMAKDFLLDVAENDHGGKGVVFDGKGFPRELT